MRTTEWKNRPRKIYKKPGKSNQTEKSHTPANNPIRYSDLGSLVTNLQNLREVEKWDKNRIIESLNAIAFANHIKIVHDEFDAISKTSKDYTRTTRIMLSYMEHGKASLLKFQCNGVVLDANTFRVISMPPAALYEKPKHSIVNEYLSHHLYDVYKILDGTVVTLYNWNNSDGWCISSGNGYDISKLKWMGELTYAESIHDVMMRMYPEFAKSSGVEMLNGHLSFSSISKDMCYIIGFRHHNLHPLIIDEEKIWMVGCYDLSGSIPVEIPVNPLYSTREELNVWLTIPTHSMCEGTTIESLRELCADSFQDAKECIALKLRSPLNYGYILKSRDPATTIEYSNILVQSPLLSVIRKLVYDSSPKSIKHLIDEKFRMEYMAMRAYLTPNGRLEFIALFPEWAPFYKKCGTLISNICQNIFHLARQNALPETNKLPSFDTQIGKVSTQLFDHICTYENLVAFAFTDQALSVIRDYVVVPEYAYLFLTVLCSQKSDD